MEKRESNDNLMGIKHNLEDNVETQEQKQWGIVWVAKEILETYCIIEKAKSDPSTKDLIDNYSTSLFRVFK